MNLSSWSLALDAMKQTVDIYIKHANHLHLATIGRGRSSQDIPELAHDMTGEQELVYINSKLDTLADIEEQLKASRVLLTTIRNSSTTLAPIARLPTEVLSMVLMAGHNDNWIQWGMHEAEDEGLRQLFNYTFPDSEVDNPDAEHFSTTFSHVSHHWRELAINTAAAWTHIDLSSGFERAAEWIKRSKRSNLSLKLSMMGIGDTPNRALSIIDSNVIRTTSLTVNAATVGQLLDVLRHVTVYNSLPPIKRLALSIQRSDSITRGYFNDKQWEGLISILGGLEHVRFSQITIPFTIRGLKSLRLESLLVCSTLHEILCECPELESLHFNQLDWPTFMYGLSHGPKIVLAKLKTVLLQQISTSAACSILSAFSAPSLEKFTILYLYVVNAGSQSQPTSLADSLLPFLKTMRPTSLKSLCIYDGSINPATNLHLDQLLVYTPELEHLYLCGQPHIDDLLTAISHSNETIPKLKTLWLKHGRFSVQRLRDTIWMRNYPGSERPIEFLVVKHCEVDDEWSAFIDVLQGEVEMLEWEDNWAPVA